MDNTKPTICLNMIVKDESHIIESTLKNITDHINIDYWVISDTGSADNTIEIITNFFSKLDIPGEIHEDKWENFGYNRTKAVEYAYNKTDYVLFFDADDLIAGNLILPSPMDKDSYNIKFGSDNSSKTWVRNCLVSNRLKWKWVGVIHEYVECCEKVKSSALISGDYYFDGRHMGARSKDPNKFLNDALILEKAYETEKDVSLKARYSYYCGQSFDGANNSDKAIEWYTKSLDTNIHFGYKYVACINIGNIYKHRLKLPDKAILSWMNALKYDSSRIEGVVNVMEYYYQNGSHFMVGSLAEMFKDYKIFNTNDKMFLDPSKYYMLEYYNSISAFYCDKLNSGYESCKKLLLANKQIDITLSNIRFYKDNVIQDTDSKLIKWISDYIIKLYNKNNNKKAMDYFNNYKDIIRNKLPDDYKYVNDLMDTTYDKEILIIIDQTGCTNKLAREIFKKNNNQILDTIIEISNMEKLN